MEGLAVGRICHYINDYGRHCAAMIVDITDREAGEVTLCVYPWQVEGGSRNVVAMAVRPTNMQQADLRHTWHWPERE